MEVPFLRNGSNILAGLMKCREKHGVGKACWTVSTGSIPVRLFGKSEVINKGSNKPEKNLSPGFWDQLTLMKCLLCARDNSSDLLLY